ncbi:MAG TPA: hypothetical protein VFH70_13440, partial [Acidimicrobiales bacterium]|nr:hypothetical protein [Acidimicrobiales bacterium]
MDMGSIPERDGHGDRRAAHDGRHHDGARCSGKVRDPHLSEIPLPGCPSGQFHAALFQAALFHAALFQAEPFQAALFQALPFQAAEFHAAPFQAALFQALPFQAEPFQAALFQAEPFQAEPPHSAGFQVSAGPLFAKDTVVPKA